MPPQSAVANCRKSKSSSLVDLHVANGDSYTLAEKATLNVHNFRERLVKPAVLSNQLGAIKPVVSEQNEEGMFGFFDSVVAKAEVICLSLACD